MKIWKRDIFWLGLILLVAAGLKLWLLLAERVPFNADEAVVALMARHILQGERPIFFYGQAYMGSLDAWLVAGGFAIFGQQVWVIRLLQTLLYLGTIATTYLIGKTILGSSRTGLIAAALLAVPTVNVTLYTTASLGGYGEAILIG
ncbi:MAG: glycosyltransferase family 39 protein, partial [Longilinea sp.]|nr:glycosyltransferase family 39 protein [Longilinea sp.]